MELEFPEDFNPDFSKAYDLNGNQFIIEIQNRGIVKMFDDETYDTWAFRLISKDTILERGPFRWNTKERNLTSENVANHLASYYGYGEFIKTKLEIQAAIDARPDVLVNGTPAEKARFVVWKDFYSEKAPAVELWQVYVVSLSVIKSVWVAYIETTVDEEKLYRVSVSVVTDRIHVEVFHQNENYIFKI